MTTDPKQPLRLTQGNTAKERARGRRARRVFHGTLATELNDRGAATVEELYLRFDCFLLPLETGEIRQVLESARREGVVAEVSDKRDGYGGEVSDQWTTTDKGKKLRRPRTLALPDLGYLLLGEHDRTVKAFNVGKTVVTMAIPVFALVGIHHLDKGPAAKWAAFGGVGAVILLMFAYGLRGELDLRAAAASWPRLIETRQKRWEYQMSWFCMAFLPALLATVYLAAGLWLGLGRFPWPVYVVAALAAGAIYVKKVWPLYHAWHRTDPALCRHEWSERGDEAVEEAARAAQAP